MLVLGLSAWDMIESQEFAEPRLDVGLVTRFVPALMSLVVDDHVRSTNQRLPPEERETAQIVIEHSGPPPEAFSVGFTFLSHFVAILFKLCFTFYRPTSRRTLWQPCWPCTTPSRPPETRTRLG